jgi:hypothetical protein
MNHSRPDYDRIQDPAALIPDDEPVFFLRAQDEVAAATVRFWAALARAAGADPMMIQNARDHADRMDAWAKKKVPDLPASVHALDCGTPNLGPAPEETA